MKEILFILLQLVLQRREENRAEQINTIAVLKNPYECGKKNAKMDDDA